MVKNVKAPITDGTFNTINYNFNSLSESHRRIQTQLNDLVLDAGKSDQEVAQARGGHQVLADRLNSVDSQLAHKPDYWEVITKSEGVGLNDAKSDLLAALQGGEDTSFKLLSVPRPQSVSAEKTTFIARSSNVLNRETIIPNKVLSSTDGTLLDSDNYHTSDYIPVSPDTDYTFLEIVFAAFYDESKNFIFRAPLGEGDEYRIRTVTSPERAYWMRVSYRPEYHEEVQINEGDELLPYEPYYEKMNGVIVSGHDVADNSLDWKKTTFIEQSSNLFNKGKATPGIVNRSDGRVIDSENFHVSELIEVRGGSPYTSNGILRVMAYDKRLNPITHNEIVGDGEGTWTTPKGTGYVRLSVRNNLLDEAQFNKGDELLPYEPYYVKLKDDITTNSNTSITGVQLNIPINFEVSGLNTQTGHFSSSSDRDYETKRRTGKFLNVLPGTDFHVEYDKGNLLVFEYDKNFSLVRCSELESNENIKLNSFTEYIKVSIENLVSDDVVGCNISYWSLSSFPKWVKNIRINSDNISFTYLVNSNEGRDVVENDSEKEQYTTERYYNAGLLKLPPNYNPTGKPVKLIIWNNGAGGYASFENTSFNYAYEEFFQYLADEGYAILGVYSWTTRYFPEGATQENFGSPISMSAFTQAYKWVIENYNIDTSGVFVSGKSAGGYTGFNMLYNKGIPVSAAGMLAPALSPLERPFGYDAETKIAYADDFGFEGDTESILGVDGDTIPRTEELKGYIIKNAEKMIGYNPWWNGLIGLDLDTLATRGAEETDDDFDLFKNIARVCNVPTKVWVSEDDGIISVDKLKIYLNTIKNAHGIAELRLLPDGTGQHHSTDYDENALKVDAIKTRLGINHTNVPLAFVEMVQFFRRFEN